VLHGEGVVDFPRKSIWKVKGHLKVAFFWSAALGKILTIKNLRRQGLILVNWCCMCKQDREYVDHLLLYCSMVRELWALALSLFGVHWAMPKRVTDLLACWKGWLARHHNGDLWSAIPLCIIWKERNGRTFEDTEQAMLVVKLVITHSFSSLLEFLDFCTFM